MYIITILGYMELLKEFAVDIEEYILDLLRDEYDLYWLEDTERLDQFKDNVFIAMIDGLLDSVSDPVEFNTNDCTLKGIHEIPRMIVLKWKELLKKYEIADNDVINEANQTVWIYQLLKKEQLVTLVDYKL